MKASDPRILFILPSLKPGGAEHQTAQQINALYKDNWEVYLCVLHQDLAILNKIELPEDRILILSVKSSVLNFKTAFISIRLFQRLYKFSRKNKITHTVANLPLGHWYGRVLRVFNPRLKLFTYHRSMQYQASPLNTIPKFVFNWIQSKLASRVDNTAIFISEAVKENIQKRLTLNRSIVIHNTVHDVYSNIKEENIGFRKKDTIQLIVPGRLHTSKGHFLFLEVYQSLPQELQNRCQVTFAGGGPLEGELQNYIINNDLKNHVAITGFLENEDLLLKIYQSDLVIIPSIHEGFGNVAVEALMLGKTIIASDAGGLKEVIRDNENGYSFTATDGQSFKAKLQNILEIFPTSLLDSISVRQDYLVRFSFSAHMSKFKSLFIAKEQDIKK